MQLAAVKTNVLDIKLPVQWCCSTEFLIETTKNTDPNGTISPSIILSVKEIESNTIKKQDMVK